MRLCHSRMYLVQIFPRESQEMVFEAHERAFRLFVGKKRDYNRRFQEMCSHHLVEPVARPRAPTRAGAHDVRARQGLAGRRGRLRSRLVPGRPLSPLPLEFGRRRCPMGLVLRRSSESLVPVRGLRDLIRDTAHRARG